VKDPEATATKERKKSGRVVEEEAGPMPDPPPRPSKGGCSKGAECEVTFARSATLNLGNYESMRIEVALKMPCPVVPSAIEKAYALSKTWVDGKLEAAIAEAPDRG